MTLRDARTFAVLLVALGLVAGVGGVTVGAATLTGGGGPTATAAQTTIDSCTTIDEPGRYVLTTDIEAAGDTAISQSCFEITADDVTFDGNGHTIDGRGESHTKAIAVVEASGVTVTNFEISDWHAGVLVENGSVTVENVRTFSNAYGVRLVNAGGSTITNSTVENNLIGVYTDDVDVTLEGNTISENEIAVKRTDSES